jgi:hypothetical protein
MQNGRLVVEIWLAEDITLICVKNHRNHATANFVANSDNKTKKLGLTVCY